MRIERIHDIQEVLKCMPFEMEIIKKGREPNRESNILNFVESQLQNPLFGFWIAYGDNENVLAYTFSILSLIPGLQRLIVLRIYAKDKNIYQQLYKIVTDWAKQYHVKIMQVIVTKRIKAIQRTFKFIPISVVMERRI